MYPTIPCTMYVWHCIHKHPSRSETPVNEFSTEGYFMRMFPTLKELQTFRLQGLANTLTIGNHFKHLLL